MTLDSLPHPARPFSLCEVKVFYWMSSEIISTHIMIKESHFLKTGNCREFVKYGLSGCFPDGERLRASEPRGRLHTFCSASVALTRTCGQRPSRPRRATEPSPSRPSACRVVSTGLEPESFPEQAGPVVGPHSHQATLLALDLI